MEFFFQESANKSWNLFLKRADGTMVWIANRADLAQLRNLVA